MSVGTDLNQFHLHLVVYMVRGAREGWDPWGRGKRGVVDRGTYIMYCVCREKAGLILTYKFLLIRQFNLGISLHIIQNNTRSKTRNCDLPTSPM